MSGQVADQALQVAWRGNGNADLFPGALADFVEQEDVVGIKNADNQTLSLESKRDNAVLLHVLRRQKDKRFAVDVLGRRLLKRQY
jgi:hypothetical protein